MVGDWWFFSFGPSECLLAGFFRFRFVLFQSRAELPFSLAYVGLRAWFAWNCIDTIYRFSTSSLSFGCTRDFLKVMWDQIYKQKFGVALGSPVSPIAVNIIYGMVRWAIHTAPIECKPRLCNRYVDDILEIVKKGSTERLTDHLNQVDRIYDNPKVYLWRRKRR